MKYVKTFENFNYEETPEDVKKLQDPNSVEFKALVANLAKEKGVDAQQAVTQAIETAKDSTEKANEEIAPMAILALAPAIVAVCGLVGLVSAKFSAKRGLKNEIHSLAKQKVTELIKKDPNLANNYERLISQAYDEMMNDKELIAKVKKQYSDGGLVNRGQDTSRYYSN